jgi:hypothetical protein
MRDSLNFFIVHLEFLKILLELFKNRFRYPEYSVSNADNGVHKQYCKRLS